MRIIITIFSSGHVFLLLTYFVHIFALRLDRETWVLTIFIYKFTDLFQPTLQGGRCDPGTYCPAGASYKYNCTLGMYCSQSELSAPEGFCDEGYYCPGAATSPQEFDCPVGHFCPNGTGLPQPCRNGTYAPTTNLKEEGECTPCDGGFYCNGTGLSAVSGVCDAGM